jgi:tRNA-specific 2-thiouridylase
MPYTIGMNRKKQRKRRVLVGMTGRLESTIAAFLLKKQGFECLGVSVSFYEQDKITSHFQVEPFEHTKRICEFLEMPFYAVDAKDLFQDRIVASIAASRLSGEDYSTASLVHTLLLEVLAEKAEVLKADEIVTGHFGKVHKSEFIEDSFLLASSDIERDQSELLSLIPLQTISKLTLPLAEIGAKEVMKIALLIREEIPLNSGENLSYELEPNLLTDYFSKVVPDSLLVDGDFIHATKETTICAHDGYYRYRLGENHLIGANDQKLDSTLHVVKVNPHRGAIFVDKLASYHYSGCLVQGAVLLPSIDFSHPYHVMVKSAREKKFYAAEIFFKSQGFFLLRFTEKQQYLFRGQHITVYFRQANSLKLIASGLISKVGDFDFYDRLYSKPEEEIEDEEAKVFLKLKSHYGFYF